MFNYRMIKLILILIPVNDIAKGDLLPRNATEGVHKLANNAVCYSASCKNASRTILNSIDATVNPCDDFYNFACGGFILKNEIEAYSYEYSTYSILNKTIFNQLRNLLKKKITKNEIKPFRMVKQLYRDCLKADIINDKVVQIIGDKMEKLGGWPQINENLDYDNESWISTLEDSRNLGFISNYIFSLNVDKNSEKPSSKILYVEKPYLKSDVFHPLTDKINKRKYLQMMVNMAMKNKMPYDEAKRELTPVLEFECALRDINNDDNYLNETFNNYPIIVTIDYMQKKMPSVNWLKAINALLGHSMILTTNDAVLLTSISNNYLIRLEKLVRNTQSKTLINFILWRNVQESLDFYFFNSQEPKWKNCVVTVRKSFEIALSAMYFRTYFSDRTVKQNILKMVRRFKEEQYRIISASNWINEETRKDLLNKSQSIVERVVYAEELWDDKILIEYYKNVCRSNLRVYSNPNKKDEMSRKRSYLITKKDRKKIGMMIQISRPYIFAVN